MASPPDCDLRSFSGREGRGRRACGGRLGMLAPARGADRDPQRLRARLAADHVLRRMNTAAAIAVVMMVLALGGCGDGEDGGGGDQDLVARHLYMGVACGTGNEVGCDRVAISVQVPSRPDFVVAIVAGHRVRMVDIADRERHRGPFVYEGAIEPEGLLAHGPLAVDAEPGG